MDWTKINDPVIEMHEASGDDFGRWFISQTQPFSVRAAYTLPRPNGMRWAEHYATLPEPIDFGNPEHRKMWASVSPQSDLISAASFDLMKAFIAALHAGPAAPKKSVEDTLFDAGFKSQRWGGPVVKIGTKGFLSASFAERGLIRITYAGKSSNRTTTLLLVRQGFKAHSTGEVCDLYFPEGSDVQRSAAEFIATHLIPFAETTDLTQRAYSRWDKAHPELA